VAALFDDVGGFIDVYCREKRLAKSED